MAAYSLRVCDWCGEQWASDIEVCPVDGHQTRSRQESDSSLPTTCGPYQIIQQTAKTRWGEFFEGQQNSLRDRVSIQVLYPLLCIDPLLLKQAFSLSKQASEIGHPNIALLHETGFLSNGRAFLVFESLVGTTFSNLLSSFGSFHPEEILPWSLSLLDILQVIHQKNLIHGALRAESLFLQNQTLSQPTLVDFGIGQLGIGTLNESEKALSTSWDLRAIGILLYQGLTGQTSDTIQKPVLAQLPNNLQEIIQHALNFGFSQTSDMAEAIKQCLLLFPSSRSNLEKSEKALLDQPTRIHVLPENPLEDNLMDDLPPPTTIRPFPQKPYQTYSASEEISNEQEGPATKRKIESLRENQQNLALSPQQAQNTPRMAKDMPQEAHQSQEHPSDFLSSQNAVDDFQGGWDEPQWPSRLNSQAEPIADFFDPEDHSSNETTNPSLYWKQPAQYKEMVQQFQEDIDVPVSQSPTPGPLKNENATPKNEETQFNPRRTKAPVPGFRKKKKNPEELLLHSNDQKQLVQEDKKLAEVVRSNISSFQTLDEEAPPKLELPQKVSTPKKRKEDPEWLSISVDLRSLESEQSQAPKKGFSWGWLVLIFLFIFLVGAISVIVFLFDKDIVSFIKEILPGVL